MCEPCFYSCRKLHLDSSGLNAWPKHVDLCWRHLMTPVQGFAYCLNVIISLWCLLLGFAFDSFSGEWKCKTYTVQPCSHIFCSSDTDFIIQVLYPLPVPKVVITLSSSILIPHFPFPICHLYSLSMLYILPCDYSGQFLFQTCFFAFWAPT
jgi:hypothetical protein